MNELERKLLARCTDPDSVTEAWNSGVRAEVFEEPLYQAIWNFTVDYWQKAQMKSAPTPWALTQEFPGYTVTDDAQEETGYLADLLRRRFATNQLQEMLRTAASDSVRDPIGSLKTLHAAAFAASEVVVSRVTRENMADTIEARREEYAKLQEYPEGVGVPYGFDLLDLHTGGLMPGELAVIGAKAKVGKTMMGLWGAVQAARRGYKPIVFSLEMSLREIRKRIDAQFSGVSYNRLLHGKLKPEELKALWEAQEELRDLGGIQVEMPEPGDRTIAAMLARTRQYGADYLFIDQLSFIEPGHKTLNKKEQYASVLKALKIEISRPGAEIPCMLAVQLRREDDEPTMSSFADAAEVERDVDVAMSLYRNRDLYNNGQMRLDLLGARRSAPAAWLLNWELSEYTRFTVASEIRG